MLQVYYYNWFCDILLTFSMISPVIGSKCYKIKLALCCKKQVDETSSMIGQLSDTVVCAVCSK